jgi:cell wall-associated NlpC family hydrolase
MPADPSKLVTMSELDAQLVAALGLTPAARRIRIAARDAGLAPASRLGTETVARLLGLRLNHPQGSDDLELLPSQPATRAEAAYSLARAIGLTAGQVTWLDQLSQTFSLPELDTWQRAVLGRALRFVGYPYVWGGTSEVTQKLWSTTAPGGWVTAPGGFDCSGFVWRVYKTKPFPGAPLLGDILKGRTTYAMSGEVKKPARIGIDGLEPGDVIFFGAHGPKSTPLEVSHTGIYVGNGWFVHSSGAGVTLQPLQGWYTTTFAWARRPLLEAGLTAQY